MRVVYNVTSDQIRLAAQKLRDIKRDYWRLFFGFGAVILVGVVLASIFNSMAIPWFVQWAVAAVVFISALACWVGGVVMFWRLRTWRCPQCRERFFGFWGSGFGTRCRHCGLDVRA
jgi:uncharacterized membrane protein YraQ (UPF0718 family)